MQKLAGMTLANSRAWKKGVVEKGRKVRVRGGSGSMRGGEAVRARA